MRSFGSYDITKYQEPVPYVREDRIPTTVKILPEVVIS